MRYQDWDVILFPESSNIPFQEFRTACFCAQDPEYTQPQPLDPNSRPSSLDCTIPVQLPIVAGFIPSLPWGLPFRISIHCWQTPHLARPLDRTPNQDEVCLFEARVFVDGCCVAATLFKPTDTWPQVIDTTNHMDKNGNRDSLRFPPFYPEALGRHWWNAAANVGRIKVIIAEGFGKIQRESVFERVKNIVCYNFQHAPLVVLERFGIAWPNPGMWFQPRQLSYAAPSFALHKRSRTGPDAHAHAHSPRDRIVSRRSTISTCMTTVPPALSVDQSMPPPAVPDRGLGISPDWTTPMNLPDPFIDHGVGHRYHGFGGRSASDDLSMPDYPDSITAASSRDVSGTNTAMQKAATFMGPVSHEQADTVSNTIGVRKDGTSGTFAPRNDRRSSNVGAETLNMGTKPSAAAEVKVGFYSRKGSAKGRGKWTKRKKSNGSTKPQLAEESGESQDTHDANVNTKPAGNIQGKKEGKNSDLEVKQPETSTDPSVHAKKENARMGDDTRCTVSEGKRKRNLTVQELAASPKIREVQSSPTRRTSRKVSQGGRSATAVDDIAVEEGAAKAPLQVLENVL